MQLVKLSILGFFAGFLAVLIFHQSLWYLLNLVGLIPLDRLADRSDPAIRRALGNLKSLLGRRMGRASRAALARFNRARLLGRLDHHWCGRALARSLLRSAPDKGRAHPGALAAFPRGPSRQRRVGSRHRLVPKAGVDDPRLAKLSTDQARLKQKCLFLGSTK
jgi:hypothetical protein